MNNLFTKINPMVPYIIIVFVILVTIIIWDNKRIVITQYEVASNKLPEEFHGFRIAHLSDLHNGEFGKENYRLVRKIRKESPDMIIISGDLLDSRRTDFERAYHLCEELIKICPVYYATGNHEARIRTFKIFQKDIENLGVRVLRNRAETIKKDSSILLIGIDDPSFVKGNKSSYISERIKELSNNFEGFKMLISHRPEFYSIYYEEKIDLIFSGHAHGGQFRLPFVGGIVAPNQGLFPRYSEGLIKYKDSNLIVSRGIGNSIFPFRINNPPEVVIVNLKNS